VCTHRQTTHRSAQAGRVGIVGVMASTDDFMRAAMHRDTVLLTRDGRTERVRLLYWPGDNPRNGSTRWRAKVQTVNGAIFVVDIGAITLLNGENIVADEIDDDTKYRNFRSLQPASGSPTAQSDKFAVLPPVRNPVGSSQPRVGCSEDESDHVARVKLPARGSQQDT